MMFNESSQAREKMFLSSTIKVRVGGLVLISASLGHNYTGVPLHSGRKAFAETLSTVLQEFACAPRTLGNPQKMVIDQV